MQLEIIPDGIISPDDHPGHFPCEIVVGWDIWEDDGGLTRESFQFGDGITLIDHHGLKAQIKVTEKYERRFYTVFVGLGTIEGYTASEPKIIKIEIENGRVHSLSFIQDGNDHAAFNSFPLWQEALEHQRKAVERREASFSL